MGFVSSRQAFLLKPGLKLALIIDKSNHKDGNKKSITANSVKKPQGLKNLPSNSGGSTKNQRPTDRGKRLSADKLCALIRFFHIGLLELLRIAAGEERGDQRQQAAHQQRQHHAILKPQHKSVSWLCTSGLHWKRNSRKLAAEAR